MTAGGSQRPAEGGSCTGVDLNNSPRVARSLSLHAVQNGRVLNMDEGEWDQVRSCGANDCDSSVAWSQVLSGGSRRSPRISGASKRPRVYASFCAEDECEKGSCTAGPPSPQAEARLSRTRSISSQTHSWLVGQLNSLSSGGTGGPSASVSPAGLMRTKGRRKTLSVDVNTEILRGVRSECALRLFGKHLSPGSAKVTPEYECSLSELVQHLDDFVSHDWKTGRWWKFTALCVVYNSRAALVVSGLVGILAMILMQDRVGVLPKSSYLRPPYKQVVAGEEVAPQEGYLCGVLCPLAFVFMLLFWQRIRSALLRPRYLFVDKLCINQADEASKREGICSLAGFLKHTDRVVLLWSPRYFTRLWCVYEVATWIHLGRDLSKTLVFAPCIWCMAVLMLHSGLCMYYTLLRFGHFLLPNVPLLPAAVILIFSVSLLPIHATRRLTRELQQLPLQLGDFSVRNAECFCCANRHRHPVSGARLPCDRALVYDTLVAWEVGPGAVGEGQLDCALDAFDSHVRTGFKDMIVATFSAVTVPYRDALIVSVPSFWFLCDAAAGLGDYSPQQGWRAMMLLISLPLATVPCYVTFVVWLIRRIAGWKIHNCVQDVSVTVMVALAGLVVVMVLWATPTALQELRSPWPQVCLHVIQALITIAVFYIVPCRAAAAGEAQGQSDGEEAELAAAAAPVPGSAAPQSEGPRVSAVVASASPGVVVLQVEGGEEQPHSFN